MTTNIQLFVSVCVCVPSFTGRRSTYHLMVYSTESLESVYEEGLAEFLPSYWIFFCFACPFEKLMKVIFFRKMHLDSKVNCYSEFYSFWFYWNIHINSYLLMGFLNLSMQRWVSLCYSVVNKGELCPMVIIHVLI